MGQPRLVTSSGAFPWRSNLEPGRYEISSKMLHKAGLGLFNMVGQYLAKIQSCKS